jgi:DNA-directed RNA polymerase specialized sigma24 family protein
MSGDVTQLLSAIESGDSKAADELLPRVYDELRRLAGARMAQEQPGHTLQPTALVHEAWLRLVKLRYFVGLNFDESASALGIAVPTAKQWWAYARAWLSVELRGEGGFV